MAQKKSAPRPKANRHAAKPAAAASARSSGRSGGSASAKTSGKPAPKAAARTTAAPASSSKSRAKAGAPGVAKPTKKVVAAEPRPDAKHEKPAPAGKPPKPGAATAAAAGKAKAGRTTPAPPPAKSGAEAQQAKKRRKALGSQSVAEAASAGSADAQGYVFVNGRRVRMISTGGKAPPARSKPRKPDPAEKDADQGPKKPIKSPLSSKELREFREILVTKRSELLGDLNALEKASLESGGASHLSNHMADVGTDTYDQDFMLGMAETERAQLREIDEAIMRIENKTYGVCMMTGQPIPKARLNAKPWARYTIEAARKMEGRWGS